MGMEHERLVSLYVRISHTHTQTHTHTHTHIHTHTHTHTHTHISLVVYHTHTYIYSVVCTLRIHLETSSVLLRQLPVEFLKCPVNWKYAPLAANTPAGSNEFVQIHEKEVIIGKPYDFPTYGWDNEYGIMKMQ